MTHAALPALRLAPELAKEWEPLILSYEYEPRLVPAREKGSALIGMAMTEKQGGSDVRANTTRASATGRGGPGEVYVLTGHKWFCSAPMSDAFLVLAQAPGGLTCFFVPRVLPDGSRNPFAIARLKDKLGNRSNASTTKSSSTARSRGRSAKRGAASPRSSRWSTSRAWTASPAAPARCVRRWCKRCTTRITASFSRSCSSISRSRNVLADLALESEAATLLFARLARACDRTAAGDENEARIKRIGTAIGKYWVCKRAPAHVGEALKCLGGNGYVEESIMPRLFRESPLNSIWEGSGNVNALDVLRALQREPGALKSYLDEVRAAQGANPNYDAALTLVEEELADGEDVQFRARRLVEAMALLLQAALMLATSPNAVADAFCATRLGGDWGRAFGTLPPGLDIGTILERALPSP